MAKSFLAASLWLLAMVLGSRTATAEEAQAPNVVFLLVDDMGWTDAACLGSDLYQTPNIDRMAREGMRFTNAYSACTVCSPTRASVMTGKYPARLHITDWITGTVYPFAKLKVPDWQMYLPLEEVTIAEALKSAGYATAHVGKWHLGVRPYYPDKQGFDINVGGTHWGAPGSYFHPYQKTWNKLDTGVKNLPPGGKPGDYLTDRLTTEALKFIEQNREQPFFLYLPFYAVHTPLEAKQDVIDKYKRKIKSGMRHRDAVYAAMIETMDQNVGRILDKLDELDIADRTLVVFNSDNGGLKLNNVTDNTPLRAGKGSTYEGGVRVPLLVRWPGVTRAGSVCDEPVVSVDYFPTIREAVGGKAGDAAGVRPDGVSLMPLLTDPEAKLARDAIYWHYPHYHPGGSTPYGAVRESDWKLIEFYEDMRVELYNLKDDLGESRNLSESMPERAASLREKLHSWRTATGAQMPSPNPDYDPQKAGRVGDMPAGLARQFRFDPDYRPGRAPYEAGDAGVPGAR